MSGKIIVQNKDFFKKKTAESVKAGRPQKASEDPAAKPTVNTAIDSSVKSEITACAALLKKAGFKELSDGLLTALKSAENESFAVAVAGEFSRGKSTFINRLLDCDILPVGDLPTTCALTRIRYSKRTGLAVYDERNKKVSERSLAEESWEGLVADNFGEEEEFKGTVIAGVDAPWLKENRIELFDTPGAGDLRDERLTVIENALLGCDGAVIAIDANSPLSLSEKLFIEERLISRKIPFLMVIITKLDRIAVDERAGVIRYIKKKLVSWDIDIPVYVPYDVEVDDPELSGIIGMDKVKAQIASWAFSPDRVSLKEGWLFARARAALESAAVSLYEQKIFLEEADNKKLEELTAKKRETLARAKEHWQALETEMDSRYGQCAALLREKASEYSMTITERLQYEAGHTNNPQKWWEEDFPYRLKIEMANMACGMENAVSRQMAQDAQWYAAAIDKAFKTHVVFKKETIAEKGEFTDIGSFGSIELKSLDKQRRTARVVSTVISISGVALLGSLGMAPMFASMGIGAGTSIISEKTFQKKLEAQKAEVKKELGQCIPKCIEASAQESERRLAMVYADMVREAGKSQEQWLAVQEDALSRIKAPRSDKKYEEVSANLAKVEAKIYELKE